jgi:hypothetical protein
MTRLWFSIPAAGVIPSLETEDRTIWKEFWHCWLTELGSNALVLETAVFARFCQQSSYLDYPDRDFNWLKELLPNNYLTRAKTGC